MGRFSERFGGRGNRVPRVKCKCGVCGEEFTLGPATYRSRMAKSKSGILYHKKCYLALMKKKESPAHKTTKPRVYKVSGNNGHGCRITVPLSSLVSKEYTCEILHGGIIMYTPVVKEVANG